MEHSNDGGVTPLHAAASDGDERLVDLLLERGADPFALTDDKARPSDLAAAGGHAELANKLRGVEHAHGRG